MRSDKWEAGQMIQLFRRKKGKKRNSGVKKPKKQTAKQRGGTLWCYAFWSLLVVGMLGVMVRCWDLQCNRQDKSQERAQRQQLKIIPQIARRGLILDRAGRVLAMSIKTPSISLDPTLVTDPTETAIRLAELLDLDADALYERLQKRMAWNEGHERKSRYLPVKRFVSAEQGEQIKALKLPGVIIDWEYQRQYPMGRLAAHVLGFTNSFGEGLEGVEAKYNTHLSGTSGKMILKKDVKSRTVGSLGPCVPARDGANVVLSIDAVIQACVEEQLDAVMKKYQAKTATGIVMDPRTGEVLALANRPAFHPAEAGRCEKAVLRNRALTDPYEPGSTFKPITVSSALEGGFYTLTTKIDCGTGPYIGKGFGRIPEYKRYFGVIPVAEVIMRSSNIGAAKIAQKMGPDYYYGMLERFGFGRKTGIDLPEPGAGIPRDRIGSDGKRLSLSDQLKKRYGPGYTLTRVAYGQTISMTSIQLLRAFCCIANGGRLLRPRVALGVIGDDGEVIEKFGEDEAEGEQVLSAEVSRAMVEAALARVVSQQGGTAHRARLEDWRMFGKTGTAQVAEHGRYVPRKHVSSFIAGAPAEHPRVCTLVLVREPNHSLGLGYTGGVVAAPAVKEIMKQTLAYLEVPRSPKEGTAVARND